MKPFVSLILSAVLSLTALAVPAAPESVSLWLPYWESEEALQQTQALGERVDTAIAFGAIFDSEDHPLMLPEAEELLRRLQSSRENVMLSIVNDVQTGPGVYDNKSPALLERLFRDEDSISRHIEDLFRLVDTYGLTGLEIDYEGIRKDETLWEGFSRFVQRLSEQFSAQGLRLRVVLSWDAPKYMTLPQGPEYSVMCYNLYGSHSGPGPKADFPFLEEICGLYQPYTAAVHMAFATGGFDWGGETTKALTQNQAQALLAQYGIRPARDENSGVLVGSYLLDGTEHTVWYADGQTLTLWAQAVRSHGFESIDLFRAGGNDLSDWEQTLFRERSLSPGKE